LAIEPWNRDALLGLAELAHRAGLQDEGLEHVNRVLQLDAYDAEANFLAGTLYRTMERAADARDAFGWAARSTGYRSAAYSQLAELMIGQGEYAAATRYARLAVDFDRHSVTAWRAMAIVGRQTGNRALTREALEELLDVDPLHHFVRAEAYLASPGEASARALVDALGGEYPDQTLLEMAIGYLHVGLADDALALLELELDQGVESAVESTEGAAGTDALRNRGPASADRGPLYRAWRAALSNDPASPNPGGDPAFQFPFRRETLSVLGWATRNSDAWLWKYLLALNLWAVDRAEEAASHLQSLGDEPDYGPFYVARAHLLSQTHGVDPTEDLRRGVAVAPESWPLHIQLVRHLEAQGRWAEALTALDAARTRFPADFNLRLFLARALINVDRAGEATEVLDATHVLPSENARGTHSLYEQAHSLVALDAMDAGDYSAAKEHLMVALEWPESLGQGRPYEPEERLVRLLLARTESRLGNERAARAAFQAVADATTDLDAWGDLDAVSDTDRAAFRLDLLAVPALRALEGNNRPTRAGDLHTAAWAAGEPSAIADRMANDRPDLFEDLEGRMILRALRQN